MRWLSGQSRTCPSKLITNGLGAACLGLLLNAWEPSPGWAEDVRVFAAASLTSAVSELATAYAEQQNGAIILTTGASGSLSRQIVQGAPADVFLSADRGWIDYLIANGAVEPANVTAFAGNSLILIGTSHDMAKFPDDPGRALTQIPRDHRIVIADPDVAPLGRYTREALEGLGFWDPLASRLVFARDAAAVLAFVEHGAADYGIVYATDVTEAGVALISGFPAETHSAIAYFAVPVSDGSRFAADRFIDTLTGPTGADILTGLGFLPPPDPHSASANE